MIDHRFVSAICDTYGLGLAMSRLEPVKGGLMHAMYRIRTTNGSYAVKILDQSVTRTRDVRAEYRRSEAVAALFAAGGVPAVVALSGRQGRLTDIGVKTALVYPWIDGEMLPQDSAGPLAGRLMGSIIGAMHSTEVPQETFNKPAPFTSGFGEWKQLIDQATAVDAAWVADVVDMVPDLMNWELEACDATERLGSAFVVSHRDLDQKNVLWPRRDSPAIVDWEGVGLVRPALEVMSAALDWSGQKVGKPDAATFKALLAGYRERRQVTVDECRLALKVLLGATGWLRANMRASIDSDRAPERRAQRAREIGGYARSLQSLAAHIDLWSTWCEEPKPIVKNPIRQQRAVNGAAVIEAASAVPEASAPLVRRPKERPRIDLDLDTPAR